MIELHEVSKFYGALHALDSFTASIGPGELVGLLGPNGAGKTTLLSILTGNLAPTRGTVSVNGMDILLNAAEAKRMIGYLPEHIPLYDEMTVHAYLQFVCELKGVIQKDRLRHIQNIAALTGISDILPRRVGNLSKGLRQRVGVAQALCGDPEILILDEPTAGLDPLQASEFRRLLKTLKKDHTILLSSHILADMEGVCSRVLMIRDGRLMRDVRPDAGGEPGADFQLHVRLAMGKDQCLQLLRRLPGVKEVIPSVSGEPGITDAVLTVLQDTPIERELFSKAAEINTPILHLSRQRTSLEDIFLETMK